MHRIEWTKRRMSYLLKHYPIGTPVDEIAKHIGCSIQTVYDRAKYLNIPRAKKSPANAIQWSLKMLAYLRNNYQKKNNWQLSKDLGLKITAVRIKLYEIGLKRMEMEYWTDEQVEYLKANYKAKGDQELAAEFQKLWPKKKLWTKKHIEKKRMYLGIKRTTREQFLIRTGRFNPDDYKDLQGQEFPEGKKRLWFQNGKYRWMIKIGRTFVHLHRYLWEKKHGPIPKNKKLHFIDGDTTNCKLSNLVLLTRSELARRISHRNHAQLSDSYIAGLLSWRDPALKKLIINHPGIINAKREQIIQNRKIGLHRCKKSSPVISKPSKQR